MAEVFQAIAVDGAPAAVPGGNGAFAAVDLRLPERALALLSLYGEAQVNPSGTAVNRVIAGLEWQAEYAEADSATELKPFALTEREGAGGRLTWTYQDGRELTRVIVRGAIRLFRFSAYRSAATPAAVTHAMVRIRGLFLPEGTPPAELARLLMLWRGGA